MNSEQEQLHFIGVGGVGMSGIARVAHDQGMAVSGSDIKESRYTKQLRDAGVTVFIGQDGANIPDGDVTVVVSTAILENNPELIEARRRNLPIVHRAQMLARLGRDLDTLAVAGTHGKTTTSSMLASTLDAMGYDPTFLIGGIVRAYGTNAHSGRGRSYVVEADESDKSFTYLSPAAAIVTNIEADHLDHYEGLDEICAQFAAFLSGVREDGPIVVCGDDPKLAEVARGTGRAVTTYGFSEDCDARILATEAQGVGTRFTLRLPDGRVVTGKTGNLLGAASALLMNALKGVSGVDDELYVISDDVLEPICHLKTAHLRSHNPRLHSDETLLALSISSVHNPLAERLIDNVDKLRGCDAYFSVIISAADEKLYRTLGINVCCEPKYEQHRYYHK